MKGDDFLLEGSYPGGIKRTEVKFVSTVNEILLTYYFPNNNKKHLTKYIEGKLEGTCLFWYPNGVLKDEIHSSKNNRIGKVCYYPNGNIEKSETQNKDRSRTTKDWYESGQLQRVFKIDANINPSSFKTRSSPSAIGSIWTWNYSESGILIRETKENYPNGLGAAPVDMKNYFMLPES